jgi:hypothetical protein
VTDGHYVFAGAVADDAAGLVHLDFDVDVSTDPEGNVIELQRWTR